MIPLLLSLLLVTGDALTEALKHATTSADPHVRAAAARALGDTGDKSATPQLVALLRDDNDVVSTAAAESLAKLGDASALSQFIALLTEQPAMTSTGAEAGLTFDTHSTPILKEFAELKRDEKQTVAIRVLSRFHDSKAVRPILDAGLKSPSISVRIAAAIALGRLGDRRAVAPLMQLVQDDYALAQSQSPGPTIDSKSSSEVAQHIKESKAYLRAAAVWALGKIRDDAAKPLLLRATEDENSNVRDAAKEALETFRASATE